MAETNTGAGGVKAGEVKAGKAAWYAVLLLGALYIVAFVDRIALNLLIEPLKVRFDVTDTQISLLIGINFALFYAIVGLPMGRLADRMNRKHLILISTAVWALCTLASGFATAFWVLCVMRIGVAIGEAALSPSAISMIGDMFPREKRARATAVYMALGALGATGGYIAGGLLIGLIGRRGAFVVPGISTFEGWQTVFLAVACPAIFLGALMWVSIKEPPRLALPANMAPSKFWSWATRKWRPLLLLFIGGSVGQAMVHGVVTWSPSYLVRDFGWSIAQAGIAVGVTTMIGGVGGMVIWPILTERWGRRSHEALPLTLMFGVLSGAVMVIAAALSPTAPMFLLAFGLAMFALMGTGVLAMIAIQHFAQPNMRGELMALLLLLTALIAQGGGPSLVPLGSSLVSGTDADLKFGFITVALLAGPLAALFVHFARSGLLRLRSETADL